MILRISLYFRHYPKIHQLKNLSKEDYRSGLVGANYLPKVTISLIPEVVDFSDSKKVASYLEYRNVKKNNEFYKENAEKALQDCIKAYFEKNYKEDVFIMFNQDIYTMKQENGKQCRYERDALVINLTKCYILNIEAKASLSNCKKAAKQLEKTLQILKNCPFYGSIRRNWKLIRALFGTNVIADKFCCEKCMPFIFSMYDFDQKLHEILDSLQEFKNCHENAKDFYKIVCNILPDRIRIAKDLTKSFTKLNYIILKNVSQNIEKMANPQTIAFWNEQQITLADNCLNYKRVLFSSSYSTGKTLLMMNCIQELLKTNQKVLLLFDCPMETLKFKTLLQLKMEDYFKNEKVKFKTLDCRSASATSQMISNHLKFNIFIDELVYGLGPRKLSADDIIYWSELVPKDKHFWVIVSSGKDKSFDARHLFGSHFCVPQFNTPMRNPKEVIDYVKSNNGVFESKFYGNVDDVITNLKIPDNLTPTFVPRVIDASDLGEGIKMALKVVHHEFETFTPIMFIFGGLMDNTNAFFDCGCYGKVPRFLYSSSMNWHSFLNMIKIKLLFLCNLRKMICLFNEVFTEMERPKPIKYAFDNGDVRETKMWMKGEKRCDLLTFNTFAQGFEHNVVVVVEYKKDQFCNINACMRSTGMLIVVRIPEKPLDNICFGKCLKS